MQDRHYRGDIALFANVNFLPPKYCTPFPHTKPPKFQLPLLGRGLTLPSTEFDNSSDIVVFPITLFADRDRGLVLQDYQQETNGHVADEVT